MKDAKKTRLPVGFENQSLALFLLISVFATYLFIIVDKQGFWHDEIYTLSFIKGFDIYLFQGSDLALTDKQTAFWYKGLLEQDTFWENLYRNIIHEGHPPLYYLFLKLWTYVFGGNEAGLRSFSIFTSCLSLFVAFKIGKLVNARNAVLFPLLLAACPLFIYYGIEARSYSMYILLSLVCSFFFLRIRYQDKLKGDSRNNNIPAFLFSAVLLLYTHYYGIFLYVILALVLGVHYLRRKENVNFFLLAIPGIVFSLWLPVISMQTEAHHIHWTDGYYGFLSSIESYAVGAITLITGPELYNFEFWLLAGLIAITVFDYFSKTVSWYKAAIPLGLLLLYGVLLILFDKALDNHTIAVPRYYIPLQFIILFAIFFMIVEGKAGWLKGITVGGYLAFFLFIQVGYYTGLREPKQMYREAASYITNRYSPEKVQLIVSPNGPSTVGLAYYLGKNFMINSIPAERVCLSYEKKGIVIVEQRLGLAEEPWMLSCRPATLTTRMVRFVSLDVINEN